MVKQVTMKAAVRAGGAGVSKSAEDFVNTYAYRILTDKETIKVLAGLPIDDELQAAIVTLEELKALGFTGKSAGSGMQRFNAVISGGMRIPYKAMTANSKRIEDIETSYDDCIRIYRTGKEFNPNLYSTTEAGHPAYRTILDGEGNPVLNTKGNPTKVQDGIIDHEDAPEGLVEAIHNWIAETAQDWDAKLLEAVGLDKTIDELAKIAEEAENKE